MIEKEPPAPRLIVDYGQGDLSAEEINQIVKDYLNGHVNGVKRPKAVQQYFQHTPSRIADPWYDSFDANTSKWREEHGFGKNGKK